MKLAKLSLAAIVVAGLASSSFAADNLTDAFKNGKVTGELKAYYFANEDQVTDKANGLVDGNKDSIFTTGIMLNFKTDTLYGFGANFTFQGSSSPFADDGGKADYQSSMYGPGAVLSEAYISYTLGKTTALVGRMFLDTPLVASSGNRVIKQSFEGAALINTDLPNTTLIAGYVQKFQARTAGADHEAPKFTKTFGIGSDMGVSSVGLDDGAFTLAAINKSITGLTLTGAYAQTSEIATVMDSLKIAYAEAAYEGKAGSFTYGLAAQYYYNKFSGVESNLDLDANNLWGAKASLGYGDFGGYAAYSKVNNKENSLGGVVSGLGGGADLAYTASPINSTSYKNDTESYKVGLTYAVLKNANLGVNYTVNEIDSTDYKAAFTAVEADYAFEGALKGLSTSIIYEDGSKDATNDELWAKINYKF